MSAETDDQVGNISEVESEARSLGWVPQDEFRDKDKWVDAETFVKRGHEVMPILRKNNETLIRDMAALRLQVNKLTQELNGAREDLTTYQEFHQEELTRRVAETRAEVLRQLQLAHDENDTKSVVKLTDQLTQLTAAEKETESAVNGKEVVDNKVDEPALDPSFLAWQQANPLFDRDPVFTFKAMGIAAEMRAEGITTSGKEWFDEVDRRLKGDAPKRATKTEGSRGGASNGSSNREASYDALPAEAKAACDKFAQKFVGPNRTWKTVAEYRKHYADVYARSN